MSAFSIGGDQMKFGFMKGQGATEYLVLLAVVLIIALVSIALLGFFPGLAGDARRTQSDSYWRGDARPFAIMEHSASGGALSVVIQNIDSDQRTMTGFIAGVGVGNVSPNFFPIAGIVFAGGEKKAINSLNITLALPGSVTCTPAATYDLNITFTYSSPDISGQKQIGGKNLIGKCT
jgi:hypothetical protein